MQIGANDARSNDTGRLKVAVVDWINDRGHSNARLSAGASLSANKKDQCYRRLTATPRSDLSTQVESFRDEQEVLLGYRCLQHSQAASRDKRREAEIHKRLRMPNTEGRRSLLIPVQARVCKRSRTKPKNPTDVSMTKP